MSSHAIPYLSSILSFTTNTVSPKLSYLPSQTCVPYPHEVNCRNSSYNLGVIFTPFCATTQSWFTSWFPTMAPKSTFLPLVLLPPISCQQGRENGLSEERMESFYVPFQNPSMCPPDLSGQHPNPEPFILCILSSPLTSHSQYDTWGSMYGSDLLNTPGLCTYSPLRAPSLPSSPPELLLILRYLTSGQCFLGSPYAFPTPKVYLTLSYNTLSLSIPHVSILYKSLL